MNRLNHAGDHPHPINSPPAARTIKEVCEIGRRILIVEDERAMSEVLAQALRESGYEVGVAENGQVGLKMAPEFDLLVVDVMMPALNGFEMVQQLRKNGNRSPVIFLTARDATDDRVKGLDLGGDDYLVKPFKLAELLARIRALLRRSVENQDVLEFNDLWLDRRSRKARRGDRALALSKTEFSLLEFFVLRSGELVSKDLLLNEIWGEVAYRDKNLVEVNVHMLRRKIEAMGGSRLLHTVRGGGYILEFRPDEP